jgi:glycosyltransferase involved in cell wall biosynthesis
MRIVVDLQGAQATNARRGIGAYSLSLTEHLVDAAASSGDEVVIVLNGAFRQEAEELKKQFMARRNTTVEVWFPPTTMQGEATDDTWLRRASAVVFEDFVAALQPDVFLVTSLFEGLADPALTVVPGRHRIPTAVVLYDLIPLAFPHLFLQDPQVERWYWSRLGDLRRGDHLLAISDATRRDAIRLLDMPSSSVTAVGAGASPSFSPGQPSAEEEGDLCARFGISRPFALYTGGIDARKNVEGLIEAFSLVDPATRSEHQLVVVCQVNEADRNRLEQFAATCGLRDEELVLTGFVAEDDLVALYRLAKVMVFPSLYEGFGLPVLEAMQCGRAVIASDSSSLPELVGREDALFNPTDPASIAERLTRTLTDDEFRTELERHAIVQASRFSWQETARRSLDALRSIASQEERPPRSPSQFPHARRPSLAVVSPLPPEASGISDYTAMLLPYFGQWYDITVISDLEWVDDAWTRANTTVRDTAWFSRHGRTFDRVLYQFGNSSFHSHMFDLIREIPGVVILHDFALSGIVSYRENTGVADRAWIQALMHSHGFPAAIDDAKWNDRSAMIWSYPVNLSILQQALGVIVHSHQALELAEHWYGPGSSDRWKVIPMPRNVSDLPRRDDARRDLGLNEDDLLVTSFGMVGPTKLTHRLIEAWVSSALATMPTAQLVIVGENHDPAYAAEIHTMIEESGVSNVTLTGRSSRDVYGAYLAASDIGVQLRTKSRGETSASAFDCLATGAATIVNANGSLKELPDHAVVKLDDDFALDQLVAALERLASDGSLRSELGDAARHHVFEFHRPRLTAEATRDALESFWLAPLNRRSTIGRAIAEAAGVPPGQTALEDVSTAATRCLRVAPRPRHLYVDISELVQRDVGSGIQRVTRNLCRALASLRHGTLRVEFVAATENSGYRCVRGFVASLLGLQCDVPDSDFDPAPGDVFFGLDLQPLVVPAHRETYRDLKLLGVHLAFVVYDLLPVRAPQYFFPGAFDTYSRWLNVVAEADTLLSISRSVQDELHGWLIENRPNSALPRLGWFHLGAELDGINPSRSRPKSATQHRFLMVGTLEPRKRHAQVLDAFELLWEKGLEVELHIVGRRGWLVDELVERLTQHQRSGQQLVWREDASDEELADGYATSSALISASAGEGFGLPLIEAARYGLPIITRDLPVFREILGENAFYFSGNDAHDLAQALEQWLLAESRGDTITPHEVEFQSWPDSAAQILRELRRLSGYGEEGILEITTTNVSGTNGETPR